LLLFFPLKNQMGLAANLKLIYFEVFVFIFANAMKLLRKLKTSKTK
jgi:hypothetical protein